MITAAPVICEPVYSSPPMAYPTLGRVAEIWLEHLRGTVKDSTWANYAAIAKKYIPPEFASRPTGSLTSDDIDLLFKLAAEPSGRGRLSSSRLRSISTVIKSVIDYANLQGFCSLKYSTKRIRPGPCRDMKAPLEREEQLAFERWLLNDGRPVSIGILLCLYTGLRIGELCALRWGDISVAAGTLYVRRTLQRIRVIDAEPNEPHTKLILGEPKSASSRRMIPLPDLITELLAPLESEPAAYLLTSSAKRPMEPRTLQNRFYTALDAAGLRRVNFHVLRHTFATNCVNLGCDAKTLSELLGHADVGVTMNTYVHPSISLKKSLIDRLGGQFDREAALKNK